MNLEPYVGRLRRDLATCAAAGGEEAAALAERLASPLESSVRLLLLDALSAAADDITRDLAPGSVHVRLRGGDPDFVVTAPPAEEPGDDGSYERVPLEPPPADDGGTARVNLRLPEQLKVRVEDAAAAEGLSVNAWLVRAVATTLAPDDRGRRGASRGHSRAQSYTGWVR